MRGSTGAGAEREQRARFGCKQYRAAAVVHRHPADELLLCMAALEAERRKERERLTI